MDDLHVVRRDPEVVGHDLGEGGLVPLPVGTRAGDGRHPPRPLHLDAAALPAEGARLDVGREADAHDLPAPAALRLLAPQARVVRGVEGTLESELIVAGVVDLAGGCLIREGVRRDEVPASDLRGIEAGGPGRCVHEPLDDEAGLGPSRPAIGGHRRGGRQSADHGDVAGGHDIAAGKEARVIPRGAGGGVHQGGSERRGDPRAERRDVAVGIDGQLALAHGAA